MRMLFRKYIKEKLQSVQNPVTPNSSTQNSSTQNQNQSTQSIPCTFCKVCAKANDHSACVLRTPVVPSPTPVPSPVPNPPVPAANQTHIPYDTLPGGMTLDACDVIMSLVSIAENDTTSWWNNYNYCQNINDGRGMTVSLVGFCSGTSDLLWVFEDLQKIDSNHYLLKYLPALRKVNNTASTTGLETLAADLKTYGDAYWRQAVWDGIMNFYWTPAMNFADTYGLKFPISKGFLYDLALNHGAEQMPIMAKQVTVASPIHGGDEKAWLSSLISVRQNIIVNVDPSTNDGQPDRCILWRSILTAGNTSLIRPLNNLKCYGDTFKIV